MAAARTGKDNTGYAAFRQAVAEGRLLPVYLLQGEEEFLLREAVELLKQAVPQDASGLDWELLEGREVTAARVVESCETLSFLGGRRLVIVRETSFLRSADEGEEILLSYLRDPNPSTCLVLVLVGRMDGRRRLYQALREAGAVVEANPLQGEELEQWISRRAAMRDLTMGPGAAAYLETVLGNNLFLLDQEIQKARAYLGGPGVFSRAVAEELLEGTPAAGIFQLVDAAGERKLQGALRALRGLYRAGEAPARINAMLARQYRLLLQTAAQGPRPPAELARALGVPLFVARNLARQARLYRESRLRSNLRLLLELDLALKSSRGNPWLLLEAALVRLCAGE